MKRTDFKRWQNRIAAARGDRKVDLLLVGGKVVNVFNYTIEETSVAVYDGQVVGFGDYDAVEKYDLKGRYLSPGLIEGHIHIESSKLTPSRFAEAVVPHGTSTVVTDPHEIANVWGIKGIKFMIECSRELPLDIFYMLPSCVPATSMETSGATLSADDLSALLEDESILGIGEVMNFPGAYSGDYDVLSKTALSGEKRPVDGHAPGLIGKNLSAYMIAGPSTDHECFALDEAREKLAHGMRIMIREGSTARNLDALLPLVNAQTERRCMFVSDDKRPGDLLNEGHLDHILRRAVGKGMDPITAIRLVTINTAEAFGLLGRGGIRPGWRADLVLFEDLKSFKVNEVWHGGKLIARDGIILTEVAECRAGYRSGRLNVPELKLDVVRVEDRQCRIKVIGIIPEQIVTKMLTTQMPVTNGYLISDMENDIIKLVVVDRHSGNGNIGIGFVKGFGIRRGAIGSTVAHDSHNIIIAGVDDNSIIAAINHLVEIGGGQVVTNGSHIQASLSLPIAGLMSDKNVTEVASSEEELIEAAGKNGCNLKDPFMALSFLALPVIPELKLTDRGLVDVGKFQLVSLYKQD
ncbi:adenine deaminase [bacterium]|nr:adenine deaminase [bacterium]